MSFYLFFLLYSKANTFSSFLVFIFFQSYLWRVAALLSRSDGPSPLTVSLISKNLIPKFINLLMRSRKVERLDQRYDKLIQYTVS